MLDFIYTLLIAPLEYWMQAALLWGYSHTEAWGPAIIVMSLAVNFVILPIYIKAEHWQEGERALRKSFEAKEAMIKRTFKGQERFAMISTMHRQAGYSPFLSLRSSLGFFLQIPFFFAAYHFLSHFEPLAGVSFLGIGDLSKPDELIRVGAFSVNVMPILMTVINLASALIYTHSLTQRDKLQLYGMAALFLVLLYDAASGLVLYWTCNNIFSLCKNVVYGLVGRFKAPVSAALLNLQSRFVRRPEVFPGGWLYVVPLVLWSMGSLLALLSSNQADFVSEGAKSAVSLAADFGYIASVVFALLLSVKLRLWRNHWVILLLTVAVAYYGLRVWGKWFFLGANRKSFALSAGFLFLIPALGVLHAGIDLRRFLYSEAHSARSSKPPQTLLVPAGLWLTVLLAAYLPVQAYCTAVEVFSSPEVILAKSLLWCALIGVPIWLVTFWAARVQARNCAGYVIGALTLVFTVYAFLLPLDAGTIDAFQIADPAALFRSKNLLVDVVVVAVVLGIYAWLLRSGRTLWVKCVFVLCIIGSLVNGSYLLWQSRGQWQADDPQVKTVGGELPEYNDRLFGFSKTGQNILVVMMDAFTGTHMSRILEANPELKHELDGFVWYPDTVAAGPSTNTGVASVLCGYDCTPLAINAQGNESVAEKMNRNYAKLANKLGDEWDIVFYERNWLEQMRLQRYTDQDVLALRYLSDAYTDHYVQSRGIEIGRGNTDEFLLAVSVFSSVPWSGKNLIYRDGRWFESFLGDKNEVLVLRALKDWALFDQLTDISNADRQKNTFKFIDTELTHSPWFMDPGTCGVVASPKREFSADGVPLAHLATETCALKALAKWFAWMKKEGVWNNTTVVLASDHSSGDDPVFDKTFSQAGMQQAPTRANALLLMKRAEESGELRVDMTPMTAAEAAKLWTGVEPPKPRTHVWGKSRGEGYLIDKVWSVDGSMFEASSWIGKSP